jgi:hypothetical protein
MSYGPIQVFTATIASGADSASIGLGGKAFSQYCVQLPTMSTSAQFAIHGSHDGTTYAPCYQRPFNTSTSTTFAVVISSGVGSSGGIVDVPISTPYVKFIASAVVSGGVVIKIIAND